jgi:zinc protease
MNYYTQRNVGMISMMVLTTPDKVRDALKTMNSEISHLTDKDYFTVEEMGNARQILAVQELFGREKPTEFAHDLSYWWASAGIETYRTYQGSLSKVTEADVRRYLENYIAGKPRAVAVLLAPEAQQTLHLTSDEMVKP